MFQTTHGRINSEDKILIENRGKISTLYESPSVHVSE